MVAQEVSLARTSVHLPLHQINRWRTRWRSLYTQKPSVLHWSGYICRFPLPLCQTLQRNPPPPPIREQRRGRLLRTAARPRLLNPLYQEPRRVSETKYHFPEISWEYPFTVEMMVQLNINNLGINFPPDWTKKCTLHHIDEIMVRIL